MPPAGPSGRYPSLPSPLSKPRRSGRDPLCSQAITNRQNATSTARPAHQTEMPCRRVGGQDSPVCLSGAPTHLPATYAVTVDCLCVVTRRATSDDPGIVQSLLNGRFLITSGRLRGLRAQMDRRPLIQRAVATRHPTHHREGVKAIGGRRRVRPEPDADRHAVGGLRNETISALKLRRFPRRAGQLCWSTPTAEVNWR